MGMLLAWHGSGAMQAAVPLPLRLPRVQETPDAPPEEDFFKEAFASASLAAELAQRAQTPMAWGQVASAWAAAIQSLQTVPPTSPQWIFAQRKAREYLANQAIAQQRAEEVGSPRVFPSLGSTVLDEQLGLYLSYLATFGPPDIMVIGSSRALQGIDPQILQQQLSRQGLEAIRVYTFAVNGATAQVVSFVLRQLLTPDQMPNLIIWAGGSRSFNSGRVDRTFAAIAASPGYTALQTGERPGMNWENTAEDLTATAPPVPVSAINGYGFLPVTETFEPKTYYEAFPRVSGRYDSAYQPFTLEGVQTVSLRAIAQFAQAAEIPLVFVNLPLTADYLDETRLVYERQFQQYLTQEAAAKNFTVVDLLRHWPTQNYFFADPSHLNQRGAAQVARLLAENGTIPWQQLTVASAPSQSAASEEVEQ